MVGDHPRGHRSAWLEVDLDAIRHNLRVIRRIAGPGTAVAAVVKAEAYGHGLRETATAVAGEADALCVATLDEVLVIRERSDCRIMLLYPVPPTGLKAALEARVELTVMSSFDVDQVRRAVGERREPAALQLCVETGMGRGGVPVEQVVDVASKVAADARLRLAGIWTHLASPDDADVSRRQVDAFEGALRAMAAARLAIPPRHVASSSGIFCGTAPSLDLVRPGLAVYGLLDPDLPLSPAGRTAAAELRAAMSLLATPVTFVQVEAGGTVGYGGHWRAERSSRVAILPVGYGDGYLRLAHPEAAVLVRGQRAPVIGAVSMDGLAVDVTDVSEVRLDEPFVLLGAQGSEVISGTDLARWRNTIAWEVLSSMAARLDRVYYPQAGAVGSDTAGNTEPTMTRPSPGVR